MKEDTNMSKQKIVTVNQGKNTNDMEDQNMENNYYEENNAQENDIQEEADVKSDAIRDPEEQPEGEPEKTKKGLDIKSMIIGGLFGAGVGVIGTVTFFAFKGKKGVAPVPKLDNVVDFATKLVEEKAK